MLVSIIIPIYNVEEYIEECLESVYQQTYPNIEVILVNDCTPDKSMDIAQSIVHKYSNKYSTIIINHKQNMGISEARNNGMKASKGDYIYFIDSDDIISHVAIELLVNVAMRDKSIEAIEGEYKIVEHFNNNIQVTNIKTPLLSYYKKTNAQHFLKQEGKNVSWNILFKRSFILQHSLFFIPNIIFEDLPFRLIVAKHLKSYAKITYLTYFYRKNTNSISNNISTKHLDSLIQILQFIYNNLSKETKIQQKQMHIFCTFSFLFWSKKWRKIRQHKQYYSTFSIIIKKCLKKYYINTKVKDLLLLSPALFSYKTAKYYAKFIWKFISLYPS